jgi:hypothetical protein
MHSYRKATRITWSTCYYISIVCVIILDNDADQFTIKYMYMYCILSIKKEEKLKRQTLRKETKWDVKCMKFIVIDIR